MKTELIQITKDNYRKYLGLDIVAFSYAFGGAMGEGGGVIIATSNGKWYHTNYARQDFPHDLLLEIIPALKGCSFGIFGHGSIVPEGWTYDSLGFGNHLVVRNDFHVPFSRKCKDITYPALYQKWAGYIEEILKESKSKCR